MEAESLEHVDCLALYESTKKMKTLCLLEQDGEPSPHKQFHLGK